MQEKSEFDLVITNAFTSLSSFFIPVFLCVHMFVKHKKLGPLDFLFVLLTVVFAYGVIYVNSTV